MIWYFLYMGLLILTLLVWALVAIMSPRRAQQETPPATPATARPPERGD